MFTYSVEGKITETKGKTREINNCKRARQLGDSRAISDDMNVRLCSFMNMFALLFGIKIGRHNMINSYCGASRTQLMGRLVFATAVKNCYKIMVSCFVNFR